MEHFLRPIYQERASDSNTLGAILIEKVDSLSPMTDNLDTVLVILTKENKVPVFTKHYTFGKTNATMHIITEKQLHKWLVLGTNKKIIDWLHKGKVVFDRNEYVYHLKKELKEYPMNGRKMKMGIEFAKMLRQLQESKVCIKEKKYFDAFNHTVQLLLHVARLSIIEEGKYPEVMIWSQVKQFNVQIYQLNEELIANKLPIEERLNRVLFESEEIIETFVEECAQHIVEVMRDQEVWSIQQLHEQEELKNYSINLEVFIEYLIQKGYIDVSKITTKSPELFHRHYTVK